MRRKPFRFLEADPGRRRASLTQQILNRASLLVALCALFWFSCIRFGQIEAGAATGFVTALLTFYGVQATAALGIYTWRPTKGPEGPGDKGGVP
jgi:hypothetical protein